MKISYLNFKKQWISERKSLLDIIDKVFSSGKYVGVNCDHVVRLEKNISKFLKLNFRVLNSGTDALTLALYAVSKKEMKLLQLSIRLLLLQDPSSI